MSEIKEQQDEEHEALVSIYEGDTAFKCIKPQAYQYKYGDDDGPKSFIVELYWGDNYPNDAPEIKLDAFYNNHIVDTVKTRLMDTLTTEAQNWLGCGMTYTLFECLKERLDELLVDQPDTKSLANGMSKLDIISTKSTVIPAGITVKKEQLSKSQKRRLWEQSDHKGEKPRGYNWVDIVKHLSQTGSADECGALPLNYDG